MVDLVGPDWDWSTYGSVWELDHVRPLREISTAHEYPEFLSWRNLRAIDRASNRGRNKTAEQQRRKKKALPEQLESA